MKDVINSRQNKLIKNIKKVRDDKKFRDSSNSFFVEGYRIVKQLIENGFEIKVLLLNKDSKYINSFKDVSFVTSNIFNSLTTLNNSDGVIGIFKKRKNEFVIEKQKKYVIVDHLQNPLNLGSVIRTCVAFNVDGLFITNDSVDIWNQTLIRGSMGSVFSLPIQVSTSLIDTIKKLQNFDYKCYATCLSEKAKDIEEIKFNKSSAVVFGNEGSGLKQSDVSLCDEQIKIKITKKIDSLNVNSAASIIIYKMMNQHD